MDSVCVLKKFFVIHVTKINICIFFSNLKNCMYIIENWFCLWHRNISKTNLWRYLLNCPFFYTGTVN